MNYSEIFQHGFSDRIIHQAPGFKLLPLTGEGGPAPSKRAGTEGVIPAGSSAAVIDQGTSETFTPAGGDRIIFDQALY